MKNLLILATAIVLLSSCEKEKSDKAGIFSGPETSFHHGKAWTWVHLNGKGEPQRLGVTLNEALLSDLPTGEGGGDHSHDDNVILPLPSQAGVTPFKHVWLNWNPAGHPPANIYTKPHFDIHYYMVSVQEREQYLDPAKLNASPAEGYLPANHIGADPVPAMGKHWVDITSPELNPANPQPFTQTFIYGSYDGKVVFYEPMITLDFLLNTHHFERSIPQPAKFEKTGYYPTKMRVIKAGQSSQIILEDFVYRTAS
jgi:hypothetical protein